MGDNLDRPFGAASNHQEDSAELAYFHQHKDLALPIFLPRLRLSNPTTCLDSPQTAQPTLWGHNSLPSSFLASHLDPARLSYHAPIFPADFGSFDDLASPLNLLSGPSFASLSNLASVGTTRDHEIMPRVADGYSTRPDDARLPFDTPDHAPRLGHLPEPYPNAASASNVGQTHPPNFEATIDTVAPLAREHTPDGTSVPSILEAGPHSPNSPPTPQTMSSRKRRSGTAIDVPSSSPSAPATKRRRRASGTSVPNSDPLDKAESDNESDIIDIRDMNKIPEMLQQRQKEKAERVKLGSFQCAICMDYATTLTVTHCGHLFCADCLTTALQTEAMRHKCPMCRQKVEVKPREAYKSNTKGFWPLELKLMTATKKGKKADG